MISYREFRQLARQHYKVGGKHFIKTWDKKKFLWYNNHKTITEEVALNLFKESRINKW